MKTSSEIRPLLIVTNNIRDAEDEVRRNLRLPRHAVDLVTRGEALRGLNDRVYRIIIAPSTRQNGRNTTSDTLNQLRYLEACRAVHRATDEEIDTIRHYFTEGPGARGTRRIQRPEQ